MNGHTYDFLIQELKDKNKYYLIEIDIHSKDQESKKAVDILKSVGLIKLNAQKYKYYLSRIKLVNEKISKLVILVYQQRTNQLEIYEEQSISNKRKDSMIFKIVGKRKLNRENSDLCGVGFVKKTSTINKKIKNLSSVTKSLNVLLLISIFPGLLLSIFLNFDNLSNVAWINFISSITVYISGTLALQDCIDVLLIDYLNKLKTRIILAILIFEIFYIVLIFILLICPGKIANLSNILTLLSVVFLVGVILLKVSRR